MENLITSWEAMEWARVLEQKVAMFLLDFKKSYDRIEWGFITTMLQAFGFPEIFCQSVKVLLRDSHAQVEVNGLISHPFELSRSIRQGYPLAPTLFVIASDALYYLLRDNSHSPRVKGISLPDDSELINIQFADDTTLFFELSKENLDALSAKLSLFCEAAGAKISQPKSTMLGWTEKPPDWLTTYGYQWRGLTTIVRYLGIPFAISPFLKDMWAWIKGKIESKLSKWNKHYLSLAGRMQVCQKILSSYSIYYASIWMFNNYQINEIHKTIRDFLWSDGRGQRKSHSIKWDWCCMDKSIGSLGLKDLRAQGIALATKWIFHALEGNEPWKVLIHNNISRGFLRKLNFGSPSPLVIY